MPHFIGKLDFAPQDPSRPTEWRLAQDFGFVRDDGLLVISQAGSDVDGASIPRFMWRLCGHPFRRANRFWSVPHDSLYRGVAIIIDLQAAQMTAEEALDLWRDIQDPEVFVHGADLDRAWCDDTMRQAMIAMHEGRIKRASVYSAVRAFGWMSYRKRC
jgi:hypothetical protein